MWDDRCERMRDDLPWLVNDSLDARARHEVLTHLIRCTACRDELREWVLLREMVRRTSQPLDTNCVGAVWDNVAQKVGLAMPVGGLPFNPAGLPLDVARSVIEWLGRRTAELESMAAP